MQHLSVMALFCEDIREEVGGTFSLIGVLPDSLILGDPRRPAPDGQSIPVLNRVLSRLCLFARLHFDPDFDPGEPKLRLSGLRDTPIELGSASHAVVNESRSEAKSKGNVFAGVVFRLNFEGFRFPPKSGVFLVEIIVNDEAYIAGTLRYFVPNDNVTSSTEH